MGTRSCARGREEDARGSEGGARGARGGLEEGARGARGGARRARGGPLAVWRGKEKLRILDQKRSGARRIMKGFNWNWKMKGVGM